jgi:hypothetical protein
MAAEETTGEVRHRRRRVLHGAAAGGAVALLGACGQAPVGPGGAARGRRRGQLVYQSWSDLSRPDTQAYWGWVEKEYAARFPGASFKHEIVSFDEYPTKFTIMAAAGTVPDAMSTSNAWMRDFWALGGLTALDDLVKKAPDVAYSKFVPAAAFYGIRQGKIAGVPTGGPDSEVTLVNTRHFRAAGPRRRRRGREVDQRRRDHPAEAARTGTATRRRSRRSPRSNSRRISSPMTKMNSVISPSLIQWRRSRENSRPARRRASSLDQTAS